MLSPQILKSFQINQGGIMKKIKNTSEEKLEETSSESLQSERRNFFKKTAAYSVSALAAASLVTPVKIDANEKASIG